MTIFDRASAVLLRPHLVAGDDRITLDVNEGSILESALAHGTALARLVAEVIHGPSALPPGWLDRARDELRRAGVEP